MAPIIYHLRHLYGTNGAIKWRCYGQDRHLIQKKGVPLVKMALIRRFNGDNADPLDLETNADNGAIGARGDNGLGLDFGQG